MTPATSSRARRCCIGAGLLALWPALSAAQLSEHALRFYGTGADQQDRVRIAVDDDIAGPEGNTPLDIGGADFTLELWIRGELADNTSAHAGGDVELWTEAWREGNVLLDRHVWWSGRDFGVSIAGGFVRFGTGGGDAGGGPHTLEGDVLVLDGSWHHIAVVREQSSGRKRIVVDGALDVESSAGASTADLSYPDAGFGGADPWGPMLVLGAEKHDAGTGFPSFAGFVDELRVWNLARADTEIDAFRDRWVAPDVPGLVGSYRLEEGAGTIVSDESFAQSPNGELIAGVPGNGEWVAAADDPTFTAPMQEERLPPDFRRVTVVQGFDRPTAFQFVDADTIFVAEAGGTIWKVFQGVVDPNPVLQLAVDDSDGSVGC